jgi:hypothetical protein
VDSVVWRGVRSLEVAVEIEKTIKETIRKDLAMNELEKNMIFDITLWIV